MPYLLALVWHAVCMDLYRLLTNTRWHMSYIQHLSASLLWRHGDCSKMYMYLTVFWCIAMRMGTCEETEKYVWNMKFTSMLLWAWDADWPQTERSVWKWIVPTFIHLLLLNTSKERLHWGADASMLVFIKRRIKAAPQETNTLSVTLTWKEAFPESYADWQW